MDINWHERYDEDGFNIYGRDAQGFDRHDRDPEGFNRRGLDRDRYNRRGWRVTDIWGGNDYRDEDDYNNPPIDDDGFNRFDLNRWGFDRTGYNQYDLDEDYYNREGYDSDGYNRAGLDVNGIDQHGRRRNILSIYRRRNHAGEPIDDSDDEFSSEDSEEEILSLPNVQNNLFLDINLARIENYPLIQNPVCNADVFMHDSMATEIHRLFNKEKKIFINLYYSLGNMDVEPHTDNSLDLFTEIQRLFTQKLYSIDNSINNYNIKISILIKSLKRLLSKLYDLLLMSRENWRFSRYCDESRLLLTEAICDYSKEPPMPLEYLRTCDLYLRYIKNLCLLNDELFTDIIIDFALSNVEAYLEGREKSLETINELLDREGDSCDKGWIERLILCTNYFIKQKQLIEENALQLFKGTNMYKCVEYLITDLKVTETVKKELDFKEVNLFTYFEEFKLSEENNRIVGNLETKRKILKNKLYCFIYERLNKIYNIKDTFPIRDNINKYVDSSIYEEDFNDVEGKYKKKYLKYKNKYLNLKNKY
jgi:hypothetical protein